MKDFSTVIEEAQKTLATSFVRETAATRELRDFNTLQTARDPAKVGWPASLPVELALKTASPQELMVHYGYSAEEWAALKENPTFIAELGATCELMQKEGMSFRMKARLQAEAMLETSWKLAHAPTSEVPANVKADLIKTTFRVAGFDNKEAAAAGGGSQFNIQICRR